MTPILKDRLYLSEEDYADAEARRTSAMERLIDRADMLRDERRDALSEEQANASAPASFVPCSSLNLQASSSAARRPKP